MNSMDNCPLARDIDETICLCLHNHLIMALLLWKGTYEGTQSVHENICSPAAYSQLNLDCLARRRANAAVQYANRNIDTYPRLGWRALNVNNVGRLFEPCNRCLSIRNAQVVVLRAERVIQSGPERVDEDKGYADDYQEVYGSLSAHPVTERANHLNLGTASAWHGGDWHNA